MIGARRVSRHMEAFGAFAVQTLKGFRANQGFSCRRRRLLHSSIHRAAADSDCHRALARYRSGGIA